VTAVALLRDLSARGIRVVVRGDRLSLRGPGDVLTAELTQHLRQHKTEILEAARRCPTCCECGAVIGPADPECWWGLDRVHLDCGKRASAREWQGEVLPTDAPPPKR
jgi:tubulysin polyketide synthase-like protein